MPTHTTFNPLTILPPSTYYPNPPTPSPAIFTSSHNLQRGIPVIYAHLITHLRTCFSNIPLWPHAPYTILLQQDELPSNCILRQSTIFALSTLTPLLSGHTFSPTKRLLYL